MQTIADRPVFCRSTVNLSLTGAVQEDLENQASFVPYVQVYVSHLTLPLRLQKSSRYTGYIMTESDELQPIIRHKGY